MQKATYQENNKKDGKALFIIHQSVDVDISEKTIGVNTTKEQDSNYILATIKGRRIR